MTASPMRSTVVSPSSTSTGPGGLLEPRRDVDRVAGRETLVGAGHDLARVDSDPKPDHVPEVARELPR